MTRVVSKGNFYVSLVALNSNRCYFNPFYNPSLKLIICEEMSLIGQYLLSIDFSVFPKKFKNREKSVISLILTNQIFFTNN